MFKFCKLTVFQEKTQATLSHSAPLTTLQSSRFAMAFAIASTLSRTSATVYVWPVNPQVYGLRDSFNDLRPCFSEYMNSSIVMLSGRDTGGSARAHAGDSKTMIALCWIKGRIGKTILLRLEMDSSRETTIFYVQPLCLGVARALTLGTIASALSRRTVLFDLMQQPRFLLPWEFPSSGVLMTVIS